MKKSLFLKSGFLALGTVIALGMAPGCNGQEDNGPVKQHSQTDHENNGSSTDTHPGDHTDEDTDADTDTSGTTPGDECKSDSDCELGDCQESAKCENGYCRFSNKEEGTSCDDGNLCTEDDKCGSRGECTGTPKVCDTAPTNVCDANNDKYLTYNTTGTCKVVGNEAKCEYTYTESDCNGDCQANCASKCSGVSCDQDDSCYNIACDPNGEGTGTELCSQGAKKALGAACKIATNNTDGRCTEDALCVECLDNNDCAEHFDCNDQYACVPECSDNVCANGQLIRCTNGVKQTPTSCKFGCNNDNNDCAEQPADYCEKTVCADGLLTTCNDHHISATKNCPNGCNEAGDGCAEVQQEDNSCTESVCTNGKMKFCKYDSTLKHGVLSEEIDCGDKGCNSTGNACNFYCTFQHLKKDDADGSVAIGYARTEKEYTTNTISGGGLVCTKDLNLIVANWKYDGKPQVNIDDVDGVKEWKSQNTQLESEVDLYCTFLARVKMPTTAGGTYNDIRYICPVGDHTQTHKLGDGILMDLDYKLTADQTRQIKLDKKVIQDKPDITWDQVERFIDISLTASYASSTYQSTETNQSWTYVNARNTTASDTSAYAIDGKGLLFKAGGSVSTTITGGVGTILADIKAAFTGANQRAVSLTIGDSSTPCATKQLAVGETSFIMCEVNKSDDVNVKFSVSGAQVTIDNISWTNKQ